MRLHLHKRACAHLILFCAVLGTWLTACTKKDADPDPRDAYVGTWIERSTNGVAARPGLTDTLLISKSTANPTGLTVDGLIRSGAFLTSPVTTGSGYQADNTPVNTGTEYRFVDGSRAMVQLDKLTMTTSGNQMTMTYTFSAKSATQQLSQDFVEILVRK